MRTNGIPLTDAAKAALANHLRCRFANVAEEIGGDPYGTSVDELREILDRGAAELDRIRVLETCSCLDATPDEALELIAHALVEQRGDVKLAVDTHDQRVAEDRINALELLAEELSTVGSEA